MEIPPPRVDLALIGCDAYGKSVADCPCRGCRKHRERHQKDIQSRGYQPTDTPSEQNPPQSVSGVFTYEDMVRAGIVNLNELRALHGFPPLSDASQPEYDTDAIFADAEWQKGNS